MTSKTHVNTYGGSVLRILEAGRSPDAEEEEEENEE
jgi:hypothetical protein